MAIGQRRKPHQLSEQAWWYEMPFGMSICVAPSDKTQIVDIRWTSVRAALRRKDADAAERLAKSADK